jgi:hypothetical protein
LKLKHRPPITHIQWTSERIQKKKKSNLNKGKNFTNQNLEQNNIAANVICEHITDKMAVIKHATRASKRKHTQVTLLSSKMESIQVRLRPDLNSFKITPLYQITKNLFQIIISGYIQSSLSCISLQGH